MQLSLTFDVEGRDHPCRAGNFAAMVGLLVDASVPATHFVQGGWVRDRAAPNELAVLSAPGMVIGLHGDTHTRFLELSGDAIERELAHAEQALLDQDLAPTRPLFRLPYLSGNTDGFVLQSVAALGWWHIDAHAVAYDWKDELRDDPRQVARNVVEGIERRRAERADTAIVLFHSWPDPAPDALRQVLEHALGSGDTWVPLLDIPRRDWNNGIQLNSSGGARAPSARDG